MPYSSVRDASKFCIERSLTATLIKTSLGNERLVLDVLPHTHIGQFYTVQ
jgi:hypothetical protein